MFASLLLFLFFMLLAVVIYDYLNTWRRMRQLGISFKLGFPLVYRLPFFLKHFEDLYDIVLEEMGTETLRANKRSFLGPIMIISANPEVNKHILEHVEVYEKGNLLRECMYPLLGDGIFNVDGPMWLEQRKAASFMFAKRELVKMTDVFVKHFSNLEKCLVDGTAIEFQDLISRYTLDCFTEVAFGVETGALSGRSDFGKAFNQAQNATTRRFVLYPWWKWLGSLLPSEKILESAVAQLDSFIFSLIDERRRDPQLSERGDFLSRLLLTESMNDPKYCRDVVLNFILAGRDTTAQTILWSVYLLATHDEIFDKIVDEVTANVKGEIEFSKLRQLQYTLHFIYEVLRLYPPVPSDPKQAVVDDVLPNGIKVFAGEYVMWSQNLMGRSDRFFYEPLRCNPDRWLGADQNGGIEPAIWKQGFIPFQNGGRRTCLGQEMALNEVLAFLTCLVRSRIKFSVVPGQKIKRVPNITISALHGIWIVPHRK